MFSGNSQTAYGKMTFVCIYPWTKTDVGRCCSFKDVFELTQCYFLSSYSRLFWKCFTPEPSEDGRRERYIRIYDRYYDIDEKHKHALADFKSMSRRNHNPVKRLRDETERSGSVFYVRPNDGEAQVKRLRIKLESGVLMITECRNCKELYEYRSSNYVSGYSPLACLDCEQRWREEALAAAGSAGSASDLQAVAGACAVISNCYKCPTRIWHIPKHAQDTAPRVCAKCAEVASPAEEPPRKTKRDSACAGVRCVECGRRFWGSRCMVCKCPSQR